MFVCLMVPLFFFVRSTSQIAVFNKNKRQIGEQLKASKTAMQQALFKFNTLGSNYDKKCSAFLNKKTF